VGLWERSGKEVEDVACFIVKQGKESGKPSLMLRSGLQ